MFSLRLIIAAAESKREFDSCLSVLVPGSEGEFEILPGHEAMISAFKSGLIKVSFSDETESFFVNSGVIKISQTENETEVLAITEVLEEVGSMNIQSLRAEIENLQSQAKTEVDENFLISIEKKLELVHNKIKAIESI